MTLGRALEQCAGFTVREPWPQRLAWNLTLAALCCRAACEAYNNGVNDAIMLDDDGDYVCSGPYPDLKPTKETAGYKEET